MDIATIQAWMALVSLAASLGVKSWHAIKALGQDAGLDDAQLALLQPKWDALYDDVKRAAGQAPA